MFSYSILSSPHTEPVLRKLQSLKQTSGESPTGAKYFNKLYLFSCSFDSAYQYTYDMYIYIYYIIILYTMYVITYVVSQVCYFLVVAAFN